MAQRYLKKGPLGPLLLAGLCWCLSPAQAVAQAAEEAFPNVPWTDLMVNLPDAEVLVSEQYEAQMDTYASQYLEQSAPPPRPAPPVAAQPMAITVQPTAPDVVIDNSPSKLDIDEVVLGQVEWLTEMNTQADTALSNKNWPLAELRLAQALGEYPQAHDTRLRLAALLYGRGAVGQTRDVLQQGIELAPQQADLRLTMARLLADQQRYIAAFHQLNQAHPRVGEHLDFYSLKAEMARRSGQCGPAIDTYQQLLGVQSVGSWWLGLGLCQRQLGEEYIQAFLQAQASADLGAASHRYIAQQLEQYDTAQTH